MFDIWKNLKDVVRVNYRSAKSTSTIFLLHSRVTVVILIALSVLVTSRQYIGDPIDCISSPDVKNIADKFCWIHSTFTRGRLEEDGHWGYEAVEDADISPGIRPAMDVDGEDPRVYHTYYQWVWAVLFAQGAFFYIPYWLWKVCDRGRIKMLVSDLNLRVLSDEDRVAKEKAAILRYFTPNKGHHSLYATQYVACEVLNFLNVVMQMWATNVFLNHEFTSYGLNILTITQKRPYARHDELSRVFPVVTSCRLSTGGPAFNSMTYDLLCVLPINILNEKIYIFLWFWFLVLAFLSACNLVYRALIVCIPPLRARLLLRYVRCHKGYGVRELRIDYGDWFLLYKLGENLNPVIFSELMQEIVCLHYDNNNYTSTASSSDEEEEDVEKGRPPPPPPKIKGKKNEDKKSLKKLLTRDHIVKPKDDDIKKVGGGVNVNSVVERL